MMKGKNISESATPWTDPDDAPKWTSEDFATAEARVGDRLVREASPPLRRGRPKLESPKERVTMRLDADLLAKLREDGDGWQTRANALLRVAVGI